MGNIQPIPKCCNTEIEVPSIVKLKEEHAILAGRHKKTTAPLRASVFTEQHQDHFVPPCIDYLVVNDVDSADRRVEVEMGELEIVADVPTTSLAAFRASLLKQLDETIGAASDLSGGTFPIVFKYKSLDGSGKWLTLSPAAVNLFQAKSTERQNCDEEHVARKSR
jgi:hypothetical protein